jgi:hypothetical protein
MIKKPFQCHFGLNAIFILRKTLNRNGLLLEVNNRQAQCINLSKTEMADLLPMS